MVPVDFGQWSLLKFASSVLPSVTAGYFNPPRHRAYGRYYGANATRQYKGSLLDFGDAQSRNRVETSRLHLGASPCRTGGEDAGQQTRGYPATTAMLQVEAVVKMLQPGFNVASIAAKRRNKSNPWFKRGTLFRSAVDVLRRARTPMTAREIADALIADKAPQATRKQAIDLQAAILAAPRKRDGQTVTGEGAPARWRLSQKE
ncbi:MAG: hypothetical protein QOE55_4660 [Acidobacteriaceae bacterium]|nr:hypothetical protein [Acidobacteriaceae bacterium]